jgi:hypothetical protein
MKRHLSIIAIQMAALRATETFAAATAMGGQVTAHSDHPVLSALGHVLVLAILVGMAACVVTVFSRRPMGR